RSMPAGLGTHLGEEREGRVVTLHVLAPGAAEEAQREGDLRLADDLVGGLVEPAERRGPVAPDLAQGARLHLLEADRQRAVDHARLDRLAREEQRGRAR